MLKTFLKRLSHRIVTLRFSILTCFITFFIVTFLLIVFLTYFHSLKRALMFASELMQQITSSVVVQIDDEFVTAHDEAELSSQIIQKDVLNNQEQYLIYFTSLIKRIPIIEDVWWGDEKGNYIIGQQDINGRISMILVDRDHIPPFTKNYSYTQQNFVLESRHDGYSLDPRHQSWYLQAKQKKNIIWTKTFVFPHSNILGIATAIPVYNDQTLRGVFGLGIHLNYLSRFVSGQKLGQHGLVFIVEEDGKVIAFPGLEKKQERNKLVDLSELKIPWLMKSFEIHQKTEEHEFSFSYQGETYLARYEHIPHLYQEKWLVGAVVPQDDFIGEIKIAMLIDVALGGIIILIGVFFISNFVTRIVRPIKELVYHTEKIKQFELEEPVNISSRIKEVVLLTEAIKKMKTGLKSFKKYVPANLVRQIIEAGKSAEVSGAKKNLCILFSDIRNFTTIAESMDAHSLTDYICEYFEELSNIIVSEQGTIDKYIGDSIMAFWGAPLPIEHPGIKAARAALRCKERLKELNQQWEKQGREPLFTRIGLHMAEVIIGNIGSKERINYTALGDGINVASRLEGLNKIYGTQIIVSEDIKNSLQDAFILRFLDRVSLKGKVKSIDVYELMANHKNELSFDIDQYTPHFEKAFAEYQQGQWQTAIDLFEMCLAIYPADTVAPIFIERCKQYLTKPPRNWNGVYKIT